MIERKESGLYRLRLLQMFHALSLAGITSVSHRDLHAFAYLSNTLSPIWEVEPTELLVLKKTDGPYSTELEHELDACVGCGMINVLAIEGDPDHANKLNARFSLFPETSKLLVSLVENLPDERETADFLRELAFSFIEIAEGLRDDAAVFDATWSDPGVAQGRLLRVGPDISRQKQANYSVQVAEAFQTLRKDNLHLSKAEKIVLYMNLLKRRVQVHG